MLIVMGQHKRLITLELNKDYTINLIQRNGVFSVQVNGSEMWNVKTGSTVYRNVKYYLSDPWHASAANVAKFGTFKVVSGGDTSFPGDDGTSQIQENRLVQTIDTWGPDFNIKFDMRIVKLPNGYHNILHYTTGGNANRIPALWLDSHRGRPRLYIVMGQHKKHLPLELNKDYTGSRNEGHEPKGHVVWGT